MKELGFVRPSWMDSQDVRPYVMLQKYNEVDHPGTRHSFDWFAGSQPLLIDPLRVENVDFTNEVIRLDSRIYSEMMVTPRWVFYDCAVMPGMVTGYAIRTDSLKSHLREALNPNPKLEWTPISLFIVIPTLHENYWMAHNLGSANQLVPRELRWPGLGFISKAFGLWYANIQRSYGVTQWDNPALKLHANYGYMELVTAYSPVHTYSHSLTYRCTIDPSIWMRFFDASFEDHRFHDRFKPCGLTITTTDELSLKEVQGRLERGEGPFFLDGREVLDQQLGSTLTLFSPVP